MGANLCNLRQPTSDPRCRTITSNDHNVTISHGSSSSSSMIIDLIKLRCLKTEKNMKMNKNKNKNRQMHHTPEKKITKVTKKLTLEEWIMNSPGPKQGPGPKLDWSLGDGEHVFKNFSKRFMYSSTLEEWIMNSPGLNQGPGPKLDWSLGDGELHVFKNFSKRFMYSSSSRVHAADATIDEGDESVVDHPPPSSSSLSQNGKKLKKKVRFKLPDEADIIIFYSPPEVVPEGI